MIKLSITPQQIARAQLMSDDMGALKNSYLPNAQGNLPGFVGEIMVADHFGWKQSNTFEWDLTNDRGSKIEVKTKRCNTEPQSHYWVAIEQRHQQACDFYVFTRVLNDLSAGWILGWMKPADFKRAAKAFPKGTADPHAKGWTNNLDNLQLEIWSLNQLSK